MAEGKQACDASNLGANRCSTSLALSFSLNLLVLGILRKLKKNVNAIIDVDLQFH